MSVTGQLAGIPQRTVFNSIAVRFFNEAAILSSSF